MGALAEDRKRNVDQAGRWAVTLIRHGHRMPRPVKPLYTLALRVLCGVDFPLSINPGAGLRLAHGGRGSVINANTVIGSRVTIYHGVTVGIAGKGRLDCPTNEDDVYLGAGCCVLGGITIGRGATIGANAVVTRDVAPGATMVGPRAIAIASTEAQQ